MRHAYAKRRDANEPEIVAALEAVGAFVYRLDLPVDLLVHFRERWFLIEVKSPGADLNRKDRAEQRAFCKAFAIPIVQTETEALRVIGAKVSA